MLRVKLNDLKRWTSVDRLTIGPQLWMKTTENYTVANTAIIYLHQYPRWRMQGHTAGHRASGSSEKYRKVGVILLQQKNQHILSVIR